MSLRDLIRSAALALPLALVSCAPPARPAPDLRPHQLAFRAQFLAEFDGMQLERLYTFDPYGDSAPPDAPSFRGFRVVRDSEPAPEDRRGGRAHRGLRNIMEATTNTAISCFDAVHGATFRGARGQFDVVVSISCGNYRIYGQSRDDGISDAFEAAETEPWFGAFAAAGLIKKRQPSPH